MITIPPNTGNTMMVNNVNRNVPQPQQPIPQPQQSTPVRKIWIHKSTRNKSFLDMHHYLKSIGIKHNEFMLALIDPDLDGIDPHDPNLNLYYKQKVFRECLCNYWYFIREVVRIPAPGVPMLYKLHRGNLALNFLMILNLNVFAEFPRQQGKTVSAAIRYLYLYNFGTTNAKFAFLHKNMQGSKDNLQTLKDIRDLLPPYLVLKERTSYDGKIDKGKDSVTQLLNPHNNNLINTYAAATNRARAASLLRGKTLTFIWYDEYGFMPYNDIVYLNAAPAFKTAAMNAKASGSPYGILITTTPGFMSTEEGQEAYRTKEDATKFSEQWYDYSYAKLKMILDANTKSDFVYIRFTYQQLGQTEEWFSEICKLMKNSWNDIRREVLLEWSTGVENSPFREEDLDVIAGLVREPINITYLLEKYRFETYLQTDTRTYPPLIGVDVSGGYKQDSSTITVVDSCTTKVLGCLNCNYISTLDLARCIEFIVKHWMPNAIVNVERNGGFGATVIAKLKKMGLQKNLYYEIKDVVVEERQDGVHSYKQKIRTKVFGLTSTREIRKLLIDILIDRVENHKDKFLSPIIYHELLGMEIKRNGKIEHSAKTHDDQIFSMLMALYMWYEGVNMAERFGLKKSTIKTDDEVDEQLDYYNDDTVEIVDSFNKESLVEEAISESLKELNKSSGITINEYLEKLREQENEIMKQLISTPLGEKAYRQKYSIPDNKPISNYVDVNAGFTAIPDSVFNNFNSINPNTYSNNVAISVVPESQIGLLEDDDYKYSDHFNF